MFRTLCHSRCPDLVDGRTNTNNPHCHLFRLHATTGVSVNKGVPRKSPPSISPGLHHVFACWPLAKEPRPLRNIRSTMWVNAVAVDTCANQLPPNNFATASRKIEDVSSTRTGTMDSVAQLSRAECPPVNQIARALVTFRERQSKRLLLSDTWGRRRQIPNNPLACRRVSPAQSKRWIRAFPVLGTAINHSPDLPGTIVLQNQVLCCCFWR